MGAALEWSVANTRRSSESRTNCSWRARRLRCSRLFRTPGALVVQRLFRPQKPTNPNSVTLRRSPPPSGQSQDAHVSRMDSSTSYLSVFRYVVDALSLGRERAYVFDLPCDLMVTRARRDKSFSNRTRYHVANERASRIETPARNSLTHLRVPLDACNSLRQICLANRADGKCNPSNSLRRESHDYRTWNSVERDEGAEHRATAGSLRGAAARVNRRRRVRGQAGRAPALCSQGDYFSLAPADAWRLALWAR